MITPDAIGNILIAISAIEALTFVILYHTLARWWETEAGRHVMAFVLTIAMILVMLNARILTRTGNICGLTSWPETLVFAWLPIVLGWRIKLLLQSQWR